LVDEVVWRALRPIREVLRSLEEDRLAVRRDEYDRRPIGTALALQRARVAVERGITARSATAATAAATATSTTAARGGRRAARDLVVLRGIDQSHRVQIIPLVHEQRLAVFAELGRRDPAVRLEQDFRVRRAEWC